MFAEATPLRRDAERDACAAMIPPLA